MRQLLARFALWRDRTLRFRADWWRDLAKWLTQGGRWRRIRADRLDHDPYDPMHRRH